MSNNASASTSQEVRAQYSQLINGSEPDENIIPETLRTRQRSVVPRHGRLGRLGRTQMPTAERNAEDPDESVEVDDDNASTTSGTDDSGTAVVGDEPTRVILASSIRGTLWKRSSTSNSAPTTSWFSVCVYVILGLGTLIYVVGTDLRSAKDGSGTGFNIVDAWVLAMERSNPQVLVISLANGLRSCIDMYLFHKLRVVTKPRLKDATTGMLTYTSILENLVTLEPTTNKHKWWLRVWMFVPTIKVIYLLVADTFRFGSYFFGALHDEEMYFDIMEGGMVLEVGVHAYMFPLIACVVWIYHLLDFLWIYLIVVVTLNVYLRTDELTNAANDHKDMIATHQRSGVACVNHTMLTCDFDLRIAAPCASLVAETLPELATSLGSVVGIKLLQIAMCVKLLAQPFLPAHFDLLLRFHPISTYCFATTNYLTRVIVGQ